MKTKPKTYTVNQVKYELMKDPDFKLEYAKLQPEIQLAKQLLSARLKQKLTQKDLADKIGTGQAVISRIESMNAKPSLTLLKKLAQALHTPITLTIPG